MKQLVTAALLLTALLLSAQSIPEVEITNEIHHHLALENEYVRVFQVEVAPQQSTAMHWHRHDYIFVTLGDSHVSNEVKGKSPVELKLQDGETRLSPAPFAHIARNLAPTPFRNVAVELLQDEKARAMPPAKWDEERGLHVLNAGTQEILFVKDNARVSEIELQPGGMIPKHHHNGPHLVVAISDVETRSDLEGKAPMPGHLKSGDVKWVPGGYTHTLTNVGKQPAKFVTIEFPGPAQSSSLLSSDKLTIAHVLVKADISERGEVLGAWIVEGPDGGTSKQALRAVKSWTFHPATKDGKPVRALALIDVNVNKGGEVLIEGKRDGVMQ